MARFASYLGILAALAFGALLAIVARPPTPAGPASLATSTLAVLPGITLPALSLPDLPLVIPPSAAPSEVASTSFSVAPTPAETPQTAPRETTPSKIAQTPPPVVTSTAAPVPAAVAVPPPPTPQSSNVALSAAAEKLRAALVNIICYAPAGSRIHSISGSGVIVDAKGIILTNAHVAQYFLLADQNVSCTIRTGSPAADAYTAALIYLPAAWISENAKVVTEPAPSGDGQHDYALLAITGSATQMPLPASFPFVPLATTAPVAGEGVAIGTYGAQFLQTAQVQTSLFPTLVYGSVKGVYTYDTDTPDIVSLGGSVAAQEGSSGGGVADANGRLVATVVTSTQESDTADRNVSALTASYIRADYASTNASALDILLAKPTADSIRAFSSRIPQLEAFLVAAIGTH